MPYHFHTNISLFVIYKVLYCDTLIHAERPSQAYLTSQYLNNRRSRHSPVGLRPAYPPGFVAPGRIFTSSEVSNLPLLRTELVEDSPNRDDHSRRRSSLTVLRSIRRRSRDKRKCINLSEKERKSSGKITCMRRQQPWF